MMKQRLAPRVQNGDQSDAGSGMPREPSHSGRPKAVVVGTDDHWSGEFSGRAGPSHRVKSLAVMGGDLYAGGQMKAADGLAVSSLAKWNGSAWSALGTGTNAGGQGDEVFEPLRSCFRTLAAGDAVA